MMAGEEIRVRESADEDSREITISFSKFELQAMANCIAEGIESLKERSVFTRGRTLIEITKTVAALTAILGRAMDRL